MAIREGYPQSEVLSVEHRGHVAIVWLDRADKLNALGPEAWGDLPVLMAAIVEDDDVRVVVIGARGRAFSVGIDLVAFGPAFVTGDLEGGHEPATVASRIANYRLIKRLQHTFTSIAECPKPVIVAIHGYCLGAGVDLITACDIRICAADAVFGVRETKMAMVADVGTMQRLPRILDPGRVAELVYTGRDFDAQEAFDMGLVTHVFDDAESALAAAVTMADEIAANSPLAVQGAKAVLRANENQSVEAGLDHGALWNAAFIQSNDFAEAVTAFNEKRPPTFTGT